MRRGHCRTRGKCGVNHDKHSIMNRETDSSGVGDAYYVGVCSGRYVTCCTNQQLLLFDVQGNWEGSRPIQ